LNRNRYSQMGCSGFCSLEPTSPLGLSVYLAAVRDTHREYDEDAVVNVVDDTVVTHAHAPFTAPSDELGRGRRTRMLREDGNRHR
jgi:hypothetical protein